MGAPADPCCVALGGNGVEPRLGVPGHRGGDRGAVDLLDRGQRFGVHVHRVAKARAHVRQVHARDERHTPALGREAIDLGVERGDQRLDARLFGRAVLVAHQAAEPSGEQRHDLERPIAQAAS